MSTKELPAEAAMCDRYLMFWIILSLIVTILATVFWTCAGEEVADSFHGVIAPSIYREADHYGGKVEGVEKWKWNLGEKYKHRACTKVNNPNVNMLWDDSLKWFTWYKRQLHSYVTYEKVGTSVHMNWQYFCQFLLSSAIKPPEKLFSVVK